MKIVCDACGAKYSIADEKVAGKVFKIRCKKCSNIIVVRGVKEEIPAADPAFQHDEKETRVFDYSGYDDPQQAVAATEGDGAVWHLVIDQEQVGPMTADDVRARFAAGEVEVDSFVWREGFDDWERLDALSEFADLASAAPAAAAGDEAAAAMFGGPALDDPLAAGGGDPADLFTAQAAAPADDGGGLFGDAGADDGGLFGAAEPMAAAAPDPVEERLTGQRNENSVLFSLNNLASLASDSPKPAASAPSGGGGAPAPQPGAAAQDGSGLIDIRAMASMYMGDSPGGAAPAQGGSSIDDLPVFSQPSIAAASPVLMPVAAPGAGNNKLMVALIAGIGALVLIAVVLLILVLRGGDDKQVASNQGDGDNAADTTNNNAANPGDNKPPETAGDGDGDNSGDGDGDDAKKPEPDGDNASAAKVAPPPKETKPEKPKKPETRAERRARLKKEKAERERRERERRERKAAEPPPSKGSSKGCDEITCLVDSSKPCCRKSRGSNKSSGGGNSNLPDRPTKGQVRSGMGRVSGAVKSCGKRAGFSGKVRVRIRISGSGRVSSAKATGGPGAVTSCVSRAVKRARFPKTQNGLSFTYGYTL